MRARSGFALISALLALVLIATLTVAIFFAAMQEFRAGRASILRQRAFASAEYAVHRALRGWSASAAAAIPIGETSAQQVTAPPNAGVVYMTRIDTSLFWVVGEGKTGAPEAEEIRRRVGMLVRSRPDSAGGGLPIPLPQRSWVEIF